MFSEKYGYTTPKVAQVESMDMDLRNGLWNALEITLYGDMGRPHLAAIEMLKQAWMNFFKLPLHQMPQPYPQTLSRVRTKYYELPWNRALDLVEFLCVIGYGVEEACNEVLQAENSAYRFIDREIAPISEQTDVDAVADALEATSTIASAREHLKSSLILMSAKTDPDFRNSIKESITAVEAVCQHITGLSKATLSDALKKMPELHPALRESLHKLYGYTSDGDGIRHALNDKSDELTVVDARFALVTCSAFCSYLIAKTSTVT